MADVLIQIGSNTWINTRYIVYITIRPKGNQTDVVVMDINQTLHYTTYDTETEARKFVDSVVNKHNKITISKE